MLFIVSFYRCKTYSDLPQGCTLQKVDECCSEPVCPNTVIVVKDGNTATVLLNNTSLSALVGVGNAETAALNTNVVETISVNTAGGFATKPDMIGKHGIVLL